MKTNWTEKDLKDKEDMGKTGMNFVNIVNPSYDICLLAVKRRPHNIQYIQNPSDELCLIALWKSLQCIKFIPNPSDVVINKILEQNTLNILEKGLRKHINDKHILDAFFKLKESNLLIDLLEGIHEMNLSSSTLMLMRDHVYRQEHLKLISQHKNYKGIASTILENMLH